MIDLNELLRAVNPSPESLSESNIKRMHDLFPVPNDWNIKWAEVLSYGAYPSGLIITDKGIVTKASKQLVGEMSKQSNEDDNKEFSYRLIPWDLAEDGSINIQKRTQDGESVYVLEYGECPVACFASTPMYQYWETQRAKAVDIDESAASSGLYNANAENVAFDAAYGVAQTSSGHGNFAEKAGVCIDRLNGDRADWVGPDNRKDGADKIINMQAVQCKYCKTASSSVGNCFRKNPDTGVREFRYYDLNGKPMQVEVPRDQYEKAVESFANRIKNGQVPGVTDPAEASNIIRKGSLTYKQAQNLAKAGTFESITFDAVTGAINCTAVGGISALVSFGVTYWRTKDIEEASDNALSTGVKVFGASFVGGIISAQLARTAVPSLLGPATDAVAKALGQTNVQNLVNALRALQGKNAIYGIAANNSFVKALQSTAISQGVFFVVFSAADTYNLMSNKISGSQYAKNLLSLMAGMSGAAASNLAAGAAVAKFASQTGKEINPLAGQAIGFAAGLVGGTVLSGGVQLIGRLFQEDDAVINSRLMNAVLCNMAYEYLMDEKEMERLVEILGNHKKEIRKIQSKVRAYDHQYYQLCEDFRPYFEQAVNNREKIDVDKEAQMIANIDMRLQPAF